MTTLIPKSWHDNMLNFGYCHIKYYRSKNDSIITIDDQENFIKNVSGS
jgi:hypothetical protein